MLNLTPEFVEKAVADFEAAQTEHLNAEHRLIIQRASDARKNLFVERLCEGLFDISTYELIPEPTRAQAYGYYNAAREYLYTPGLWPMPVTKCRPRFPKRLKPDGSDIAPDLNQHIAGWLYRCLEWADRVSDKYNFICPLPLANGSWELSRIGDADSKGAGKVAPDEAAQPQPAEPLAGPPTLVDDGDDI